MKIVTDCAAEMTAEEMEKLEITQAPLYINFPEGSVSSAELGADAFYDHLEAMYPIIPTTAQPSSGEFARIYQELAVRDQDIISIHISSGLSGTIESARLASKQVENQAHVSLFDSMTLSGGLRFQVLAAAMAARAGWGLSQIIERLEAIRAHTETIFTLETLDYLAQGGRIGRVTALMGGMLNIKPIIHVDHKDGKYTTVGKTRTVSQATEKIASHLGKLFGSKPLWVNVMNGKIFDMADRLSELIRTRLNVSYMDRMRVSPVLGVHTGPGIVGAVAVPCELMQDLIGSKI
jgi:DegV family protein with EDD domain